jgi:hypothetical protein
MRRTLGGRRQFLTVGSIAAAGAIAFPRLAGADIDPACAKCRGTGLVPLTKPKPFVFVEGAGPFRPTDAVHAQSCPTCFPMPEGGKAGKPPKGDRAPRGDKARKADEGPLAEEAAEQHEAMTIKHKEWEDKTKWKLVLVQTRHVSIHTLHQPIQARNIGLAVEAFTIHLQKTTGSLELTPTRPGTYQQMLLIGEPAWAKFRTVMESLYTQEQLGQPWQPARQFTAYDFPDIPHAYIQPERIRELPPEYQAVKFAATRQMMLATNWKAPDWLWEGLGAYGQQAALGDVRISTVYSSDKGPKAIYSFRDAKQQAVARKLRPWPDMIQRELRDYEGADYFQSMGMVAFLLDSEPAKFLEFLRLLKAGTECQPALEEAYGKDLATIGQASAKWLARG